ncbi:pentraxin fusion protein-like isoform 1-T2 [Anomaloglossus baeobatrachus]|uniref:pentraxin fusion protein-like n=1 Tax=Anomaloglossus baeobatrachus TaxID=238106 RepID=UPI003F504712
MFGLLFLAVGMSAAWAERCPVPIGVRNYAKYGSVTQSSTYVGSAVHPRPQLAIDGNHDNEYNQGSCTHTGKEFEPWWKLNLKEPIKVGTVVITNRKDCCQERLLEAEVMVSNSMSDNGQKCGSVDDVSKSPITVCCNGKEGQVITVRIPRRKEYLTLCEVQVFSYIEDLDVPLL